MWTLEPDCQGLSLGLLLTSSVTLEKLLNLSVFPSANEGKNSYLSPRAVMDAKSVALCIVPRTFPGT